MSAQDAVRKASMEFYAALNNMLNGDAAALAKIWSHSDQVTTMHPVGGRETGWAKVNETWQQVAKVMSGGQVKLEDQSLQVAGDMACEVGTERGSATLAGQRISIEHRVTNVYRQEGGQWKIVHHHTDVSPAMQDALRRLAAE